jgi:three-Cys-motif partner protein
MAQPETFFGEEKDQSIIKAEIVQKYFFAWAKIMANQAEKIAYIDLFAGPGRYETGKASTPLLVLEQAISDPAMCNRLVTIFNDKDEKHVNALETEINALPGVAKLKFKPVVHNHEIGDKVISDLESINLVPSLFFIDPFGYKGLLEITRFHGLSVKPQS